MNRFRGKVIWVKNNIGRNIGGVCTGLAAVLIIVLMAASPEIAQAQQTGFDFSQTANTITINTINTSSPNVLRTVQIQCPVTGYTVATANALFSFEVSNPSFFGTIAYSISRNSTSFNSNHQHNVFGSYVDDFHVFPASIQRVDSCNAGQNVTYRFLATRGTNIFNAEARQPKLVVVFYRDRL
ncbi:MAG TPA: hypothetical protein VHT73_04645 [Thermodesulfobacteriota bacterium]|nr:hypothetical protein [Thermodesulfobacteriota bacterium]